MPCWRHLHLLQGAHCGCHDPSDFKAGVHGCRRRLCFLLKAICTCFGVPFAAAVVQPVATAAAATPPSAPQPVTHPVLEEVSPLVCSESVVCVCNEPSDAFRVCGVHSPTLISKKSACHLHHTKTGEPSEGSQPLYTCTHAGLLSVLAFVGIGRSCPYHILSHIHRNSAARHLRNNAPQAQHG